MRMNVRGHNIELNDALHRYVERRLLFALGRFQRRIRRATVQIFDENGSRGGADKTCQVIVNLIPSGRVIVEHTEDDLYASICWATARAGRAVGREFARRREMRRDQTTGRAWSEHREGVRLGLNDRENQ